MIGIYRITNPKGKVYIGQSKNILYRFYLYRGYFCESQTKLYNSLKKYKWENHKFEIVEICEINQLMERERYWQDIYEVVNPKKGLNCTLTPAFQKKQIFSEETKSKISKANKGRIPWNKGKEYHQIKGIKHPFYGIKKPEFADSQRGSKNRMYGKVAINAKKVIDRSSNRIFNSCKEAALFYNISYSTLRSKLNGQIKNKTQLNYLDN